MPFFFDYRLYPYPLLFTYRTGYDVYNSHGGTRLQFEDPRLLLETRLLFETRLLLEVLRYYVYVFIVYFNYITKNILYLEIAPLNTCRRCSAQLYFYVRGNWSE